MNVLTSSVDGILFQRVSFEEDGIKTSKFKTYNAFQRKFKSEKDIAEVIDKNGQIFYVDRREIQEYLDDLAIYRDHPLSTENGNSLVLKVIAKLKEEPENIREWNDFCAKVFNDDDIEIRSGHKIHKYGAITGFFMNLFGLVSRVSSWQEKKPGLGSEKKEYYYESPVVYLKTNELNEWLGHLDGSTHKLDQVFKYWNEVNGGSTSCVISSIKNRDILPVLKEINERPDKQAAIAAQRKLEQEQEQKLLEEKEHQRKLEEEREIEQIGKDNQEYSEILIASSQFKGPVERPKLDEGYQKVREGNPTILTKQDPKKPDKVESDQDYADLRGYLSKPIDQKTGSPTTPIDPNAKPKRHKN